jgi:hypothetical protein
LQTKIFQNSREKIPDFWDFFFLKNATIFRAKVEHFFVPPKFDWIFFQKLQNKIVQKGWNHHKMLKEIDYWPSAGRESLWTIGEKVGFSKAHCAVQKQPNLDFAFRDLYSSPSRDLIPGRQDHPKVRFSQTLRST